MSKQAWPLGKLGDPNVAALIMGQSPPSSAYNSRGDGLPFFQGKADFGMPYPSARIWCTLPQRIAEKNDVLISVRAPVGNVNITATKCCLGRGLAAVRPAKRTNFVFLFFALLYSKERLASLSSGTTFESINKNTLEDFEIPFPLKREQEKIAAALWKLHRAIDVQVSLVRTMRELKATAMRELFTSGLRNEALRETEIGPVPESWEIWPIRDKAKIVAGGTPARSVPEYWSGGLIPWVKTGEVNYRSISATKEKITEAGLANSAAKILPAGTLLIAMYGQGVTRGKVALLGIPAATNQACAAIMLNAAEVLPEFLYYYLSYSYERLRTFSHGAQQQNLNADLIGAFTFPKPSPDEQREIVRIVQALDRKIEHHERKHAVLNDLFKTLLHKLMTGQVRVDKLNIDTSEVAACRFSSTRASARRASTQTFPSA